MQVILTEEEYHQLIDNLSDAESIRLRQEKQRQALAEFSCRALELLPAAEREKIALIIAELETKIL